MSETTIKKELSELQAQLEAISSRLPSLKKEVENANRGDLRGTADSILEVAKGKMEEVDFNELKAHVSDALRSLGNDVSDSKPKALGAAFVAGVLVGKLLSR